MGIKKLWNWLLCRLKNHQYPNKGQHTIQRPYIDDPPTRHATCLADLPPEIIQEIAALLPLASAAAFALCNHRICQILGTEYWKALGSWRDAGGLKVFENLLYEATIEPQGERADFLALLDRDLPHYIFCGRCVKLHMPIFERGSRADSDRMCARGDYFRCSFIFALPRHLRFSLLQWTMKRSRMGLDCSKQLQFFFDVSLSERIYRVKEARIRAGKCLFRVHEWFILPIKQVSVTSWDVRTTVCHHFHNFESSLKKLIECRMRHWRDRVSCISCTGLQQCRYCYTEFQIDIKEYGQEEVALVLTRWLDLGECRTPFDPKWSRRMGPLTQDLGRLWAKEGVRFVPGSIKNLYEYGENFSFNSTMSPSTEMELFAQRASLHTFYM